MADEQFIGAVKAVSWIAFGNFDEIDNFLGRPRAEWISRMDRASVKHLEVAMPWVSDALFFEALERTGLTLDELEKKWPEWKKPVTESYNRDTWKVFNEIANYDFQFRLLRKTCEASGMTFAELKNAHVQEREETLAFIKKVEAAEVLLIDAAREKIHPLEILGREDEKARTLSPVPLGFLLLDGMHVDLRENALRPSLTTEQIDGPLNGILRANKDIQHSWRGLQIRTTDITERQWAAASTSPLQMPHEVAGRRAMRLIPRVSLKEAEKFLIDAAKSNGNVLPVRDYEGQAIKSFEDEGKKLTTTIFRAARDAVKEKIVTHGLTMPRAGKKKQT